MGLRIACLSEDATIRYVLESISQRRGGWICPANLDVLRQWYRSREVRELMSGAEIVTADGMPLLWAAALQGSPLPERVAGSSLVMTLSTAAAQAGASVFLLGGNPGMAERAAERLRLSAPQLRIAGTLCPPFGFERDPEWLERITTALRDARPDIVFVGLGFPKQERLITVLRAQLRSTWFVSCGIAISFTAGEIQRAPIPMQRLGLEWLHRIAQEPARLSRRYLLEGIPFMARLMSSAITTRLRNRTTSRR